jgi:hypothetical protein
MEKHHTLDVLWRRRDSARAFPSVGDPIMETATHSELSAAVRPGRELKIFISSADEDRKFEFAPATTVGQAITDAVNVFGLDPNDAYDLTFAHKPHDKKPQEPLPKDRTLGSIPEIKDGTQLILTSRGGGV